MYFCMLLCKVYNKRSTPKWLMERLLLHSIPSTTLIDDIITYVTLEYGQYFRVYDYDRLIMYCINTKNIINKGISIFCNNNAVSTLGFFDSNMYSLTKNSRNVLIECYTLKQNIFITNIKLYNKQDCFLSKVIIFLNKIIQNSVERINYVVKKLQIGFLKDIFLKKEHIAYLQKFIVFRKFNLIKILGEKINCFLIFNFFLTNSIKYVVNKELFFTIITNERKDICTEIDLIGAIIRFYGVNKVHSKNIIFKSSFIGEVKDNNILFLFTYLKSREYFEIISYSFIDFSLSYFFNLDVDVLYLCNPISTEMSVMRSSLLPGLLKVLKYNYNRQCDRLKLFEIGEKFYFNKVNSFVEQHKLISGVCFGSVYREQWDVKKNQVDFYDLKNDITCLLLFSDKSRNIDFKFEKYKFFDSVQSVSIYIDDVKIGFIGAIDLFLLNKLKIKTTVFAFELDFKVLVQNSRIKFSRFSNKPFVRRDLSFVLEKGVDIGLILLFLKENFDEHINDIIVFDLYYNYTESMKSVSFGLFFQHQEKTLVDCEVNTIVSNVVNLITLNYKGFLRT